MIKLILRIFYYCCCCCENWIKWVNYYGFTWTANCGEGFFDGCYGSYSVIKRNEAKFSTLKFLGFVYTFLGKQFSLVVGTFFGYIVLKLDPKFASITDITVPLIIVAIVSWLTGSYQMELYGISSDALLLNYFTDVDVEKYHFG